MKNKKKVFYAVIAGILCSVICFGFLMLTNRIEYGEMVQEYANTDIYSVLSEKNVQLQKEEAVCQKFVNKKDNLYSFSLKILSTESKAKGKLQVSLINCETGEVIQSWAVDESNVGFDGYCEFVLEKKAVGVKGQLFAIEIKADDEGYVLGGTQNDSLKGGELYVGGIVEEGDVAIKLAAEDTVRITLIYGILFSVFMGALAGFFLYFSPWRIFVLKLKSEKNKKVLKEIAKVLAGTILIMGIGIGIEKILLCSGVILSSMEGGFNEYRCAFLVVVMFLAFCFIKFWNCFGEKPEKLFLVSFLIIGLLFVVAMPGEAEISWDESIHYWRAVGVSHAFDGKANYAESWLYWHSGIGYTLPNSIDNLRVGQANIQNLYNMGLEVSSDTSILSDWSVVAYIPSAIALAAGRMMGLPYALVFHMGAAMNILIYVVVLYYAMKRLRSGKMILVAIGGIPVSMFLASVYSYDSWVAAFSILGIAYFIGCMQDGKVTNKDMAIMLISLSLALMPKEIYFPLFLLYLLIPKEMFENERKHLLFCTTTLTLFVTYAGAMVIGMPYIIIAFIIIWGIVYVFVHLLMKMSMKNRVSVLVAVFIVLGIMGIIVVYKVLPQLLGTGDLRGGDEVNSAEQVRFIMENPIEYGIILLRFLKNRYLAFEVEVKGLFDTFGYIGKSSYAAISFVLLWIVAFTDKIKADLWKRYNLTRLVILALSFATICLIATALYVSFTPVGLDTIQGCQIRYILPLMFPVFGVFGFNRIYNGMSKKYYNAIVMISVNGLLLLNIWQVVIRLYS